MFVMSTPSNILSIIVYLEKNAELIANHERSHGIPKGIFWALRGHNHDVAKHDHGTSMFSRPPRVQVNLRPRDIEYAIVSLESPWIEIRIERPPRI
jgi:hypothetical protein